MAIHRRKQRGVVLLVVVSMLVLFVLIGVTYAIVSSQYRRGARIVSRQKQLGVDPEQHLDSALYQVLRDTRSPASALRGHSLLRDIYGTSVRGKISALSTELDSGNFLRFPADPKLTAWSNQLNEHAGCVLTFTTGPLKGTSTRVLYSDKNVFTVMRPQDPRLPGIGTTFVVNGRPFSGFGSGHNGTGNPTPNSRKPNLFGNPGHATAYLKSGANENYDAVDYQNMAMAAVIPGANNPAVIPSFHRPALVRYWMNQGGWNKTLQRRVILRPMNGALGDHPYFTGSNPTFDPLNAATWDVDNDNDGTPDSLWMDLGMPVQSDASGRKYKPLFAILCVDMDGKFNLNAHGSLSVANPKPEQQVVALAGNRTSQELLPGQSFGPAEVSFRGLFANNSDYLTFLKLRYGPGASPSPGTSRGVELLLQLKHLQYAHAPEVFRGNVAQGIDHYGQPIFENTTTITDLPYEANLSQPHQRGKSIVPSVRDTAYSVAELERILRSHDSDQNALPAGPASNRLTGLLNPVTRKPVNQNNHLVTTDSYDLPVANGSALAAIRQQLTAHNVSLPHELQMGLRWNINQPFGTKIPESNQRRQEYATYLYVLMTTAVRYNPNGGNLKALPALWDTDGDNRPTVAETAERIAQWAVNVVDFRDSDAIMTPFQYDPNPFDSAAKTRLVWGCERPELLITEALAFHDRRTEDLDTDEKTDDANDPDEDFDQRLQPRGSLFIELFNPWTGSNNKPQDLYRGTPGVVLNATSPVTNSPVWRMLIVKGNLGGQDPSDRPNDGAIERSIYFTKGIADDQLPTGSGQRRYQASLAGPQLLTPGRYAVAGSRGLKWDDGNTTRYINPIGRHIEAVETDATTLSYGKTRHVQMIPSFAVNNNKAAGIPDQDPASIQPVLSIPITDLSVTERVAGYPSDPVADGWDPNAAAGEGAYTSPRDTPLDDEVLRKNMTLSNYRMVYLQRLANPLLPWNATTNPYRTIDQLGVDLTTFNGVTSKTNQNMPIPGETWNFSSHERGQAPIDNNKKARNLWKQENILWRPRTSLGNNDTTHRFKERLRNSLGALNAEYGQSEKKVPVGAPIADANGLTFPTLTWNNRSFVSAHELMLVPFCSQFHLPRDFTASLNSGASYTPGNVGDFGHLPNFMDPSTGLYRIFDFLQTPTPFVQTETILHRDRLDPSDKNRLDASDPRLYPPFDQISIFRDPGKINLNTIFDKRVWDGLWNRNHNSELMVLDAAGTSALNRRIPPAPDTWLQFVASRRGYNAKGMLDPDSTKASYFSNPFRAVSSPTDTIESTVMRSNGTGEPLFINPRGGNSYLAHQQRQAHFRYQPLQRISNLTTIRSNVYAIWATVGYFEVEHVGPGSPNIYPDGYRLGQELGWDRGEIRRHRAFYMIDRSIPVAFEPGENHNVDKAILLRRFIE